MEIDLESLAKLDDVELERTLFELTEHRKYNKLDFFEPYTKQKEFFDQGAVLNERLLFAGNQLGKSLAGAVETSVHLTGFYPSWWEGRRWERPVEAWACGESTTLVRDIQQMYLCGKAGVDELFGTGFIPKDCFAGKPSIARGAVADAYDTIQVWHHTNGVRDGISTLQFKSYEQGRKKFQGKPNDFNWYDEEPDMDIYTEGNARWSASNGMSFMTFTPLQGYSEVVKRFLHERDALRGFVIMGYKDAKHMTEAHITSLLAKYPRHEWNARMNGEPLLGSGAIYLTPPELIKFPRSRQIPLYWAKLWAIDFGITHPFAAVLGAWDRDTDTIYLCATYKASNAIPLIHAQAMRSIAADVPVAWPHDGHARDKGSGEALQKQYKAAGLKMLATHAHWSEGGFSREAAVTELDTRMQKAGGPGGILVREDLEDWLQEMRMYHRKDGLIVKEGDDLMSATEKFVMMKRYARPGPIGPASALPGIMRRSRPRTAAPISPFTGRPAY